MASEIMSNPAPIFESDMPESSMGREPQGITINQGSLSNLLECITQMLQQISMVQMNPLELGKEDGQLAKILPKVLPEVVQEFQDCLTTQNCDRLLEMVNQFPAQLFLQTVDVFFSWSALHVAVWKGSQTLIDALLEKLKALSSGNDSKLFEHDFILKAEKFGLSATNMAALIGNKQIISCFQEGLDDEIRLYEPSNLLSRSPTEDEKRNLLEKASFLLEKQAPASSDQETGQLSIQEWLLNNRLDFVYCLHEAAMNKNHPQRKALEFVEFVCDNGDSSYLEPLLNVRDSLGKSPLHVCSDLFNHNQPFPEPLIDRLIVQFPKLDWNMIDFSGRTALHWAAAQGFKDFVTFLASQENTDLNATYGTFGSERIEYNSNFDEEEVRNVTPLHLAVIHNHVDVVEALLEFPEGRGLNVNALCVRQVQIARETLGVKYAYQWTPFQLAAYMGHERILQVFLKDSRIYDPGLKNGQKSAPEEHNMISALHLAASQFHPSAVKALVDCRKMDVLGKDGEGDTALHYAAMFAYGHE